MLVDLWYFEQWILIGEHYLFVCIVKLKKIESFRKSMQNTCRLSQKAKQLEDGSSKGILGLRQEGGGGGK